MKNGDEAKRIVKNLNSDDMSPYPPQRLQQNGQNIITKNNYNYENDGDDSVMMPSTCLSKNRFTNVQVYN